MEKKQIRLREGHGTSIVFTREGLDAAVREIESRRAIDETKETEARRRDRMEITLGTGEHCVVCDGEIMYFSSELKFTRTGPIVVGGPSPGYSTRKIKTSCCKCALVYDYSHGRFIAARDKVAEMRQPPGDDWEPPVPTKKKRGK